MLRYAITDRRLFAGSEQQRLHSLRQQALQLAAEGIPYLQLREKDLPPQTLLTLAQDIHPLLHPTKTKLLLNAPYALAEQAGVAWHTNAQTLLAAPATHRAASVSCHTLKDIQATHDRADLILFGPIFEKRVHGAIVQPGLGLDLLRQAVEAANTTPVLALGGITEQNTASCLQAGAAGIAAIRLFLRPERPHENL